MRFFFWCNLANLFSLFRCVFFFFSLFSSFGLVLFVVAFVRQMGYLLLVLVIHFVIDMLPAYGIDVLGKEVT